MANTELIDQLVSKEAIEQLGNLNTKLNGTYDEMEKLLGKVQIFNEESKKMGKSLSEVSKFADEVNKTEQQAAKALEENNKLMQEKSKIIEQTVKSTKESNQVMLSELKASKDVDTLMKQTLGTREQNARLLSREQKELKALATEKAKLTKQEQAGSISTGQAIDRRASLILRENELKTAISELQIVMKNEQKLLNAADGTYTKHQLTLERMRMAYRQLTDEQKEAASGKELFNTITQFDSAVKQSSESVGNWQQNVGDYAKGHRDLGRIISLVNPQLGGYVSRVQSITSVSDLWAKANKSVATTLNISTKASKALMITGVGLLIAGVATLISWYQKWQAKQEEINKIQKEFAEIEVDTAKAIAGQKVEVNQLIRVAEDYTKSLDLRKEAVSRLNELMPDYNGYINEEGVLVANTDAALKNYLTTLYKVEKAKKLISGITTDQEEIDALKERGSGDIHWLDKMGYGLMSMFDSGRADAALGEAVSAQSKIWIEAQDRLYKNQQEKEKELQELLSDTTIFDALFPSAKKSGSSKSGSSTKAQTDHEIKAYQELALYRIKIESDAQKQIASDANKSYDERYEALVAYGEKQIEYINQQRENELANEKITQSGRELVNMKADEEIRKSKEQLYESIRALDKKCYDDLYKNSQEYLSNIEKSNSSAESGELVTLSQSYAAGVIKKEEYEKKKLEIAKKYAVKTFEEEISYLENEMLKFEENADIQEKISKQLAKAKEDYAEYAASAEIKANEKSIEGQMKAYEKLKEYLNSGYSKSIQSIWSTLYDTVNMHYDNQIDRIDELEEREKEYYDDKLKMIDENLEAGLMSEEEADARKRIIEEEQLQREKEYERQRKEMQRKQAVWQKANSISQAIMNTAMAITSALGVFPPPVGIALAAIVGAMGAAQIATIASQSIPAYAKGTDNHPGGLAVVGDGGRSEMVITPSGQVWKTPARDTLAMLPLGTEVLPDFKSAIGLFAHPAIYKDRNTEPIGSHDDVLREYTKEVGRNTNEMKRILSSANQGVHAIRANSRYSDSKARVAVKLDRIIGNRK